MTIDETELQDLHSRPRYVSHYRINNGPYEYTAEEVVQQVQRLLSLKAPAIQINWEMVDLNEDSALTPSQLSALADFRTKNAEFDPDLVFEFETILGIKH